MESQGARSSTRATPTELAECFEPVRSGAREVAAPWRAVAEGVDVVGNARQREIAAWAGALLAAVLPRAAEDWLRHRTVPASALPSHARQEVTRATEATPRIAAALLALIRVIVFPHRRRGITATASASGTRSRWIVDPAHYGTTRGETRSITTASWNHPRHFRMEVLSETKATSVDTLTRHERRLAVNDEDVVHSFAASRWSGVRKPSAVCRRSML